MVFQVMVSRRSSKQTPPRCPSEQLPQPVHPGSGGIHPLPPLRKTNTSKIRTAVSFWFGKPKAHPLELKQMTFLQWKNSYIFWGFTVNGWGQNVRSEIQKVETDYSIIILTQHSYHANHLFCIVYTFKFFINSPFLPFTLCPLSKSNTPISLIMHINNF